MPERFEIYRYIVYKRRYINTLPFLSFLRSSFLANVILKFTFAICYRHSVCLSVVCNVGAPYSGYFVTDLYSQRMQP